MACATACAIASDEQLADWTKLVPILVESATTFEQHWFPDANAPNSVQRFWFAAQYPRERKRFVRLHKQYGPTLRALLPDVKSVTSAGVLPQEFVELDGKLKLRLCIFFDQQPRNARAVASQDQISDLEHVIGYFSKMAVLLAHSLLQDGIAYSKRHGEDGMICVDGPCANTKCISEDLGDHGFAMETTRGLLKLSKCSVAQICFFTLVLRHTRDLYNVRLAGRVLHNISSIGMDFEVVKAFQEENAAVLERLVCEDYVQKTLASGVPEQLVDSSEISHYPVNPPLSRVSLTSSQGAQGSDVQFYNWTCDSARWAALAAHPLCAELATVFEKYGIDDAISNVVLSYSGGVDSTAHLILLVAVLRYRLRGNGKLDGDIPRRKIPLSCLLLLYPNRNPEEVLNERQWAKWVCERLGVNLWCFNVDLARPHAGQNCAGLLREEYERSTKEIRFRMYKFLIQRGGIEFKKSVVVLGHHLDDVDENRLDHLQKGHVLGDVEGMRPFREVHDVNLLRPLLRRRKGDFLDLLQQFPVPFFRDSTPDWSVRGATRAVVDGFPCQTRSELLQLLDQFGKLSAQVGGQLDEAVALWLSTDVQLLSLPKGASAVLLNLENLFSLDVGRKINEIAGLIARLRDIWNPAVKIALAQYRALSVGEIPENQLSDSSWLLFEKGFSASVDKFCESKAGARRGHYHTSAGTAVNRKAMRHLYDNLCACRKPSFSGGLTQELGYVQLNEPHKALVLYDTSAHPGLDFKGLRNNIVDIACKALDS